MGFRHFQVAGGPLGYHVLFHAGVTLVWIGTSFPGPVYCDQTVSKRPCSFAFILRASWGPGSVVIVFH